MKKVSNRDLNPLWDIVMNNPPLKVFLPSEITAAFCAALLENGISPSPVESVKDPSGRQFTVNSGSDLKEITIALIESKPFWGCVGYAIWAFTQRHSHRKVTIITPEKKIIVSGLSDSAITKAIEGATSIEVIESD